MRGTIEDQVAGLDARLDWLAGRVEAMDMRPLRPGRWCWRESSEESASVLWDNLEDWVGWLVERYGVEELVPSCWQRHAAMLEELTALYAGWLAAYVDVDARGFDPLAWHEALDRSLHRVRQWNRQGCRPDAHRDDPASLPAQRCQ